ncbi:MAG: hypothetical protein ABII71_02080 [Candidatus Micrarchaeota archaeon]
MRGGYYLAALFLLLFASVSVAAPVDLFLSIDNGNGFADSASVTLTINGSADAMICAISNDGSTYENTTEVLTFPASMDMAWSLSAGDGEKTVHMKCANATINATWSPDVTDTIVLDTAAPEADTPTPADGGATSDTTPLISIHITDPGADPSEINEGSIELEFDGENVTHSYNPSTGSVTYTPTAALGAGTIEARIWFADNAGNDAQFSWDFTISSGPTLSDFTPEDDLVTDAARPTISVTVGDPGVGINTSRTVFKINGADEADETHYSASSGLLSYSPPSNLADGNYTIQVTVYDTSDMYAIAEWMFTVDRTDPSITLPMPSDLETLSSLSEISVTVEDSGSGLNMSTLEMIVDGVDVMDGADFDSDSGRLSFEYVQGLEAGIHTIEVTVEDNAGNGQSYFWSFTLEAKKPVVSGMSPKDDSVISDLMPEISAILSDSGTSGLDLETIRLYVDSDEVTSDSTFDVSSGKISYTPEEELGEGKHTVRVRVSNNADYETDARWEFNIDSTLPERATSLLVTHEGGVNTLTWKGSTSDDVAGYKIFASTTKFTTTSGIGSVGTVDSDTYEFTHTGGGVRYYYAIVAYDESGNEGEAAFATNCGTYKNGVWNDLECCWDSNCASGNCDVGTNTCAEGDDSEPEDLITAAEASDKIDEAEEALLDAAVAGKDITIAGSLIDQARSAFNVGNYPQAYELSVRALNALAAAPQEGLPEATEEGSGKEPNPCCPSMFVIPLLLVSALLFRRS